MLKNILTAAILMSFCCLVSATQNDNSMVVKSFINAYNQQNVSLMTSKMTDDIKWMSISDDTIIIETNSKATLSHAMTSYFASGVNTKSTLENLFSHGDYVSTVERATWVSDGQQKSQCSVAVYQLANTLISHVWYHAAQPCD